MEQSQTISIPQQRITVIDALRGFALLGVILIHMSQHYSNFSPDAAGERLFHLPAVDTAIQWLSRNVIMGKFINIFAFLFGMSFFIQMDRAAKKGIDFRKRFIWRMAILFIIGMLGNCFYSGDILSIYAVFGVFMVFLYRLKNWVLIALAALLLLGTPRMLMAGYNSLTQTEQVENAPAKQAPPAANRQRIRAPQEKLSFIQLAKNNLTGGLQLKLAYQFGFVGRGYVTLALFILGLVVGRIRFFEELQSKRKRNLYVFVGFIIAAILINIIVGFFPPQPFRLIVPKAETLSFPLLAVSSLNDIYMVLYSGALAIGFILLYQVESIGKHLDVLSPYGRMGLTNYEIQSVLGSFFFSMWGLGAIFGSWGPTEVFLLGLLVYAAQIIFSKYWLKYCLYGPLEWFWRSATYLKIQPFRRI